MELIKRGIGISGFCGVRFASAAATSTADAALKQFSVGDCLNGAGINAIGRRTALG